MQALKEKKVAILATHGFEKSELFEPRRRLDAAGVEVSVVSPEEGPIESWDDGNWGEAVDVDCRLVDARAELFDALVLPGGQINPDLLRTNEAAIGLIRSFVEAGKPVAAICHAPWLLAEADLLRDREVTSYESIATDLKNAGARWRDAAVVCDDGIITSREPEDLDAFCDELIKALRAETPQRLEESA